MHERLVASNDAQRRARAERLPIVAGMLADPNANPELIVALADAVLAAQERIAREGTYKRLAAIAAGQQ